MSEIRRETTYSDPDDVRGPLWEDAVAASVEHGALVRPDDGDLAFDGDEVPLASDDVTGNLWRYARWQWRDYWQRRGAWLALCALLGVWLLTYLAWHGG
nr:hypothetical protein [Candidatus Eremiobacteraeota bacterium]